VRVDIKMISATLDFNLSLHLSNRTVSFFVAIKRLIF